MRFDVLCRDEKDNLKKLFELWHEIMVLFVLRKLILQTRMHSHPVWLDVWFFVYFHTSCVRSAKALARLREFAGSPELSLIAYVISTIISWAGSFIVKFHRNLRKSNILERFVFSIHFVWYPKHDSTTLCSAQRKQIKHSMFLHCLNIVWSWWGYKAERLSSSSSSSSSSLSSSSFSY